MVGCIVTSDDRNVLVNLIFKPNTRFAFFRFKETAVDIQNNLHEFLTRDSDLFDRQQLVMKVRNQVSTLADRSVLEGLNLIRNQKTESLLLQNKMVLEAEFFKLNSLAICYQRWNTLPTKRET